MPTSLSLRLTFGGGEKFRPDWIFYCADKNTVDMCQIIGRQVPAKHLFKPGLRQLMDMIRMKTIGSQLMETH
ncbi:hypothetical protein [Pseudomonas salomonii]|uniref:Uncharacterized protein n=1 Tax=Pseudomonas salomonii TaxID=191391 RepID=A0A1H3FI96_9PSED|nr:hypothetical protein [Pseudomonas salomonii]SDX90741.1 hypothetical protein SAMN05216247_102152 [Pseudomonas salomonii]